MNVERIDFMGGKMISGAPESLAHRLIDLVTEAKLKNKTAIVGYLNSWGIYLMRRRPTFCEYVTNQDAVICDGFGAKLAVWSATGQKIERVTIPDFLPQLFKLAVAKGYSIAILGHRQDQLDEIINRVEANFPGIKIASSCEGYASSEVVIQFLKGCRAAKIDMLFVAQGMPLQEQNAELARREGAAGVALCVGAAFLYVFNLERRAPKWATDHGLEWLARLLSEPKRLGIRTLISNASLIQFAIAMFTRRKFRGGRK